MPRRGYAYAALLAAVVGLGVPGTIEAIRRSLGPLDLTSVDQGSTIAVDREGRLLRAFTTTDGRWRLPVATADVDPRFLDMLIAYEDRRFRDHRGVDVRALARAAGQLARRGHVVSGGSTLTMQVARLLEPRDQRAQRALVGSARRDDTADRARGHLTSDLTLIAERRALKEDVSAPTPLERRT